MYVIPLLLVIGIRGMWRALWTIQPLDVAKTSPDLALFDFLLGHFFLLLGLEPHFRVVFDAGIDGAADDGAGGGAGDAASGAGVLEAVQGDGGGAAVGDAAVVDEPLLGAEGADELFVVGDEDDAAFELADGHGETAQGVAVQEIGRFVEDEQVGVVPHGAGNHHLYLLSAREGADFVVVGDFGVQAEVLKVLGDDRGLELTVPETLAGGLVVVEFLDELVEAELDEGLARDLGVVLGEEVSPFSV